MSGTSKPAGAGGKRLTATHAALSVICGLMLLSMMFVTLIDVVGRYLFGSPLQGATELTALLLVSTIFIGLPAVCLDEENVTVDLLTDHLPAFIHPARRLVVRLLSAVVLMAAAWRIFAHGQALSSYGETTVSLHLPVAPFAYLCAAATAVAALITLRHAISRS
ncbi:TRAP-type C4-dicarboxylate transport system permease small subunit [Neorhizobium galegae]|uniref:TRAP transporter small permease n=1 Tax=Neorhizobium galegae TaxID=399 RepID=UPI001AE73210|nr:TRAP transporter small permease [Neorhizobium galegae]MBP2548278.1 TRAP-type C4-dicarboxylate transport system permease small subunit [Neorhizobium galegae]